MYANYKINMFTLSATTATTINIPFNLEYQIVDNGELVERVFVDIETQNAVNPILDYDKVRFIPVYNGSQISNVNYNLYFLNPNNNISVPTYYSNIGFEDSDIKFRKNTFKESYLYLGFYNSDNAMTQTLVSEIDIFNMITIDDFYPAGTSSPNIAGQVKSANQIPTRFILSNPLTVKNGFYEGYYLYNYKDEFEIGIPKYLYMKASYFNAKTGKFLNLMTESSPYSINDLVNKLYTRYKLYRDTTGFYYEIDSTYSNNVIYSNDSDVTVKLYQIQSL